MSDQNPETIGAIPAPEGNLEPAYDTRVEPGTAPPLTVTLEMINGVIMDYFANTIQPQIDSNGIMQPVPVMYGSPERWSTVRRFGVLRDPASERLLTPLIMLRRSRMVQGKLVNPNNKYLYTTLTKSWNVRNSYDQFAARNGITPSQELRTVMIPDYIDLTYDVLVWTDLQSQMDKLVEHLNVENHEFWGARNNFKFKVNMDAFESQSELPAATDRIVRTSFSMNVSAYLIPERMIENMRIASTNKTRFTPKKVTFTSEFVNNLKKPK